MGQATLPYAVTTFAVTTQASRWLQQRANLAVHGIVVCNAFIETLHLLRDGCGPLRHRVCPHVDKGAQSRGLLCVLLEDSQAVGAAALAHLRHQHANIDLRGELDGRDVVAGRLHHEGLRRRGVRQHTPDVAPEEPADRGVYEAVVLHVVDVPKRILVHPPGLNMSPVQVGGPESQQLRHHTGRETTGGRQPQTTRQEMRQVYGACACRQIYVVFSELEVGRRTQPP